MNKHLRKLVLAGMLVPVSALATEMRTPWVSANGPLRYTFEKLHTEKGHCNFNMWSALHMKEASKAFLTHGTKTQDISALIFNKQDFTLNEIFPNSLVPPNSQNFNLFMAIKDIHPRVEYMEYGVTVGARWDHPVCEKGRIGLRATVPFRRIEMERKDSGLDESEDPLAQFVSKRLVRVALQKNGNTPNAGPVAPISAAQGLDVLTTAYRMDLLGALPNAVGTQALQGTNVPAVTVLNSATLTNTVPTAALGAASADTALSVTDSKTDKPFANAFMVTTAAIAGVGGNAENVAVPPVANLLSAAPIYIGGAGAGFAAVPTTYDGFPTDGSQLRFFDAAGNYANVFPTFDLVTGVGTLGNAGFQKNASTTWMIFRRANDSTDAEKFSEGNAAGAGNGGVVARAIEQALQQYTQNVFSFLKGNDFDLDSRTREGLGDVDLDLFYEHTFNNEWMAEAMLGVRIPTGSGDDQWGNPYRPLLGNGEHWEIKLGLMGCYQPLSWMNMKLDAKYAFVLESDEERMAAFKGAKIKNFGPKADCDVDWGYFVGHFDFNFFHPKDSGIRSTLGYEFYYKGEDEINFKQAKMQSWLGGAFNAAGVLEENLQPLDNNLAETNTESIAHKVRFETSAQLLKYFEIFAGGSMTFAGQNVMRDRDAHGGFNIRF